MEEYLIVRIGLEVELLLIAWNVVTLLLMLIDKNQAKQGGRRISERTLFLCALLFGAFGILAGMYTFRHKTKHVSFVIGVPCLLVLNLFGYFNL